MTATDSIIDRLDWLYGKGYSGYTAGEKSEIEGLSLAILGHGVKKCNCPDRWRDAVIECRISLKANTKSNYNMATTASPSRQYHLRNGVTIEWNHKIYTHVNITDEVAEAYLAKFPNGKVRFEAIPDKGADKTADKTAENADKTEVKDATKSAKKAEKTASSTSKSGKKSTKTEVKAEETQTKTAENADKTE